MNKIQERRNAIKYFPYLFDNGYHVIQDDLEEVKFELDFEYNRHEENNFSSFYYPSNRKECVKREEEIKRGYNFINNIIEERKDYSLNSLTSATLVNQYFRLSDEIGKYKFVPHFKKSYGYNQNKANDAILMNLVLLEDVVKKCVKDIDEYLKEKHDDSFRSQIDARLNEMICNNEMLFDVLRKARHDYHDKWTGACRDIRYRYKELGDSKQIYRKTKNAACRRVLDFAKELVDMDMDIMKYKYATLREDFENRNKVFPLIRHANGLVDEYDEVVKKITYGPYCYSLLTSEEAKEKTRENKENKKLMKTLL